MDHSGRVTSKLWECPLASLLSSSLPLHLSDSKSMWPNLFCRCHLAMCSSSPLSRLPQAASHRYYHPWDAGLSRATLFLPHGTLRDKTSAWDNITLDNTLSGLLFSLLAWNRNYWISFDDTPLCTECLTNSGEGEGKLFSYRMIITTCCLINIPVLNFSGKWIRCCSTNVSALHYSDSLIRCNPLKVRSPDLAADAAQTCWRHKALFSEWLRDTKRTESQWF